MGSLSYWEKRQVQDMYGYMEGAEETADQISGLYLKASRYLTISSDEVFEKFKKKHRLTDAEARQLVNKLQDKGSPDELLQKLKNGDTTQGEKELLAEMEAPAYQARLERFRQLQDQLDYVMQDIYQQEKEISTSSYTGLAKESYYKGIFNTQQQVGAAFSFNTVDPKVIDRVVGSRWHGENYSERIWGNTQQLAQDLKEELLVNLVTGRTNREAAEIIANKFGQGSSNARRLVRTESNYVATELNFAAYEECGIEKYQFLATLDLRTSKQCQKLDGKIFFVKDRKAGANSPPIHPWCRSTTVSVVDEKYISQMKRSARDPVTGRLIEVPGTMNYQEWHDTYVKGRPEAEAAEKMAKNRSADRKQYEEYKKVLGSNMPKTLDEFQKMKYNNRDKWEYTKGLKSYLEKYPNSDKRYYDIQVELKKMGIKKGIPLPSKPKQAFIMPDTTAKEPTHLYERMLERNITDYDLNKYMKDAKAMFVQWGGNRQVFYSDTGICVITKAGDDWLYKTAWTKTEFDNETAMILEVISKYVK